MLDSNETIIQFYREAYEKEGPTPGGMRWGDAEAHWKRLTRMRWLIGALDIPIARVLDVGCGIGMLYKLWNMEQFGGLYHGVDIVPEYVEEANKTLALKHNAIVTCDDFMQWWAIEPFNVVAAVGTFAWQSEPNVLAMIDRMWNLTAPQGAMAFTYIPEAPLSNFTVARLFMQLPGVEEVVTYAGYTDRMHEQMVIITKESTDSAYPYKHEEEIEQEILNGEHREEEYASRD